MGRHTNVFFELNGSGKTSLLRILESTMSGYPTTLSRVPFTRVEVVSDSNDYQQQFTRVIEKPKTDQSSQSPSRARRATGALSEDFDFVEPLPPALDMPEWKYKGKSPRAQLNIWRQIYFPTHRAFADIRHPSRGFESHNPSSSALAERGWDGWFANELQPLWNAYTTGLLTDLQEIQTDGIANILKGILSTAMLTTSRQPSCCVRRLARNDKREGRER